MASVKWIKSITVIDHTFHGVEQVDAYRLRFSPSEQGRPVQRKYVRAAMKPPGIPDMLSRTRFVDAGAVPLTGMAWSGFGGIVKVEVSTDDRRLEPRRPRQGVVAPHLDTVAVHLAGRSR
jgi:hypothetical protein